MTNYQHWNYFMKMVMWVTTAHTDENYDCNLNFSVWLDGRAVTYRIMFHKDEDCFSLDAYDAEDGSVVVDKLYESSYLYLYEWFAAINQLTRRI